MHHVLDPRKVSVASRRNAVAPTLVVPQPVTAPVGHVERRIGQNVVGTHIRMAVIVEGVAMLNLTINSTDSEIHLRQTPRRVVRLLAENG